MSLHVIEKQNLLGQELSEDAVHLAQAIYNTYIEDHNELYMEIKIELIISLLNIPNTPRSVTYIIELLEEINEPIGVKNFKFYGKEYDLRFITFCTYDIVDGYINIELNEEFLHAEKEYMLDSFLKK